MRIIGVDLHARQQTIAMFYKRRCQGKHFPAEQRPSECSPRHRAPVTYERLFGLALAVCPMNSARRVQRRGYLVLPSPQFHLPDGDDASRLPKLTSEAVVWWQPWFYLRLVAYSFFGLSEGA